MVVPERRKDWLELAGKTWDVLSAAAFKRNLISYKEVGNAIGLHHRVVSYPLGQIQTYCDYERLPLLPSIVVNARRGKPGAGSLAHRRVDLVKVQKDVFEFPWENIENPFGHFAKGDNLVDLADQVVHKPDAAGAIYAKVKVRGIAQQLFRDVLLKAYEARCAMCSLSFTEALEAAHIVRWNAASPQERMDPRNGILLCATHHKLFDARRITVDKKFRVRCVKPKRGESTGYSAADRQIFVGLHGKPLSVPGDDRLRPLGSYIQRRNEADE